jgi:hypothetical protein
MRYCWQSKRLGRDSETKVGEAVDRVTEAIQLAQLQG